MRPLLLLLLCLSPFSLSAQGAPPQLAVGADLSLWHLDCGTASAPATLRVGPSLRAGLLLPSRAPVLLQLSVSYTPEGEFEPGLLGLGVEAAPRLLPSRPSGANVFLSVGGGLLHFAAQRQEARIAECNRSPTCLFEGISYRSGWRTTLSGGIGADLPVSASVLAQPTVQILKPLGEADAGRYENSPMLRLGIGLSWRPRA